MKCYNGCPCTELQALIDAETQAFSEVKKLNPNAHCTYHHPTGCHNSGYQVHEWGKAISGFHQSKIAACCEAVQILSGLKKL